MQPYSVFLKLNNGVPCKTFHRIVAFTDVFIRRDLAVLSLIVTPLCTSLMRALETHKSDELFWKILVNTRKVHFSWLSLINDRSD